MNSTCVEVNKETDIIIKYNFKVKVVVFVVVTYSIIFVIMVLGISWLIIKKRRTEDGFHLDRETISRIFNFKELIVVTNGFANDIRLRRGGSGQVYEGVLSYLGTQKSYSWINFIPPYIYDNLHLNNVCVKLNTSFKSK